MKQDKLKSSETKIALVGNLEFQVLAEFSYGFILFQFHLSTLFLSDF